MSSNSNTPDPPVPDSEEKTLEDRVRFALRAMIVAIIIFTAGSAIGFFKTEQAINSTNDAIDQINAERDARIDTVSQIIDQNCNTNNSQDQLLANLLTVALNADAAFGENVDPNQLTDFDLKIQAAISKIQRLQQAGPPSPVEQAFQKQIDTLKDLTPCQTLVALYIAGKPIPTNVETLNDK